jgi:hypothetical protein
MIDKIARALAGHQKRNAALRETFEKRNVNVEEPRPIDFHFWAWTQSDAAVLGRALYQMGFLIRLLAPAASKDDPERWAVEAGAKISLNEALSDKLTERLITVAAREDAIFDGWGTSV